MSTGKLWLAIWMGMGVCSGAEQSEEVHVFVRGTHHADLLMIRRAQLQASEMLRSAGIRLVWKSGQPDSATCCNLQLVLEYGSDRSRAPDVMAYAFPYGNGSAGIKILYTRITAKRRRPEKILAHVIVHEVTHMLQGIARHSDTGIMKAYWSREDYDQMQSEPLVFTTDDIRLIQLGVSKHVATASREKASGLQ